jgi:hypothetical protein
VQHAVAQWPAQLCIIEHILATCLEQESEMVRRRCHVLNVIPRDAALCHMLWLNDESSCALVEHILPACALGEPVHEL